MLKRLVIQNLATIENVDIEFNEGFTVLTGQTGAGKSLVIDSLSLLLGARASVELIRSGEDRAIIKGYFNIKNARVFSILAKLDIPFDNDEIIVERVISLKGNAIKINGVNSSLNELNQISTFLADIHNQFDIIKILDKDNYLSMIDGFSYDLTSSYKNDYLSLLNEYHSKKKQYLDLIEKKRKIDESKDFYLYQLKELEALELTIGEEESITEEISLLSNYDKIYSLTQEASEIIHSDFLDKLYDLNKIISSLSSYQKQYEDIYSSMNDHYYDLDDKVNELSKMFRNMDYDPSRLATLQERLSAINSIKKKYKRNVPELIEYMDELSSMVGKTSTIEEDLLTLKDEKEQAFNKVFNKGKELTLVRKKIAQSIKKEIERNLTDLLLKARFEITFNDAKEDDSSLKESGIDEVNFLIETNVGEGLKPLEKVVSGGEASRIMLAFKVVFIKANKIATVIFDEIDTGISGEAAERMAKKIYETSLLSQVIAISHMPQVASLSDHHILISKSVKQGRTFTSIKELSLEEKINEIAKLISGDKVTDKQLEYAKEMVLRDRN